MTDPAARWLSDWPQLLVLTLASLLLVSFGVLLGAYYCDYRRESEVQQLSQITQQVAAIGRQCVETLGEVVPAAIVLARQDRPTPRTVAVRDSSRERRWVTP